jgi:hypothetical protein
MWMERRPHGPCSRRRGGDGGCRPPVLAERDTRELSIGEIVGGVRSTRAVGGQSAPIPQEIPSKLRGSIIYERCSLDGRTSTIAGTIHPGRIGQGWGDCTDETAAQSCIDSDQQFSEQNSSKLGWNIYNVGRAQWEIKSKNGDTYEVKKRRHSTFLIASSARGLFSVLSRRHGLSSIFTRL